jgi:hypothetical protein
MWKNGIERLQALWRSYRIRSCYQFVVVDVIIVQSVFRRWSACREAKLLLEEKRKHSAIKIQKCWRGFQTFSFFEATRAAVKIQAVWRGAVSSSGYRRFRAARKIQAAWRCFQAYTDYIFILVDIVKVQRTVRCWLAHRKIGAMRKERAAMLKARREERAAVMLQKCVRCAIAKRHFQSNLSKIRLAQVCFRTCPGI